MIPAKYWSPTKKLMVLGAMAGGKLVEDTATGNPLTFITDKAKPLKSLLIPFTPQQSGTGDPSPENIRSILPWNGLNVGHCEKNMFNGIRESGYISDSGVIGTDGYNFHSELIKVESGKKYTYSLIKNNASSSNKRVHGYDIFGNWVEMIQKNPTSTEGANAFTFTVPNGVYFIRVQFYGAVDTDYCDTDIQIEPGETATAYEPYNGTVYHASFPSPVYGGTLDVVSGVLTVLWKRVLLKGEPSGVSSTYQGSLFYTQQQTLHMERASTTEEAVSICGCVKRFSLTNQKQKHG